MFKAIVIAACLVSARAAVTWRDCATKGSQTAVTVHAIDLRPNPVVFPGELHVDLDMTVNQKMDQLFVDVELWKNTSFGESKIPCIGDTNIGTCQNVDACAILPRIRNGSSVVSSDLGLQLDKILLTALGHQGNCPINPENITLHNEHITLQALPAELSLIATGDYRIVFKIKDDPTATDNIGCLELNAGIRRKTDPASAVGR
ncbi:uncharacterized protein LOC128228889 [Mya arenaria]|uniref:uncharacterized protein LOC128228889 n=1 Tax=Mya arenaria TaxID=6604 RepID=UPI0022E157EB|nr:uncharacterized protein LOC128228889 [Mya arenaria]